MVRGWRLWVRAPVAFVVGVLAALLYCGDDAED